MNHRWFNLLSPCTQPLHCQVFITGTQEYLVECLYQASGGILKQQTGEREPGLRCRLAAQGSPTIFQILGMRRQTDEQAMCTCTPEQALQLSAIPNRMHSQVPTIPNPSSSLTACV